MEAAESEIHMSPKLFIIARGTRGGRVHSVSRTFNKLDVSTALCTSGINVEVSQLTMANGPREVVHNSIAIQDTVEPQKADRIFTKSHCSTWLLSDELEFFETSLYKFYRGREQYIGLTSARLKKDDIVCQFSGSDVAAIIRRTPFDSMNYSVIGRALLFWKKDDSITNRSSLEDWAGVIEQKKPVRPQFTTGSDYYTFFLDIETLHRLTR
jgi:hypothetical protein